MVRTIKVSEQMRKEYRILPAVIMDAIDEGLERGKSIGFAEGEARGKALGLIEGKAEGSHQKALETARLMKQANCENVFIAKMTGLTAEEIRALDNN